jgi:microcystin degradation protein MlrC
MTDAPASRPRILIGAILHETNTFNRVPTCLADFEGRYLCLDPGSIRDRLTGTATEMAGFMSAADRYGWQAELAVAAACGPSGPLVEADWAALKARLLDAQGPFDGVLLALHGAMVTAGSCDPEGDLLSALRDRLGPHVPVVVTLDMHANVSPRMIAAGDAFLPYETYPHVDHVERATEAARALARLMAMPAAAGRLTRTVIARPPMLDAADHGRTDPPGPMNALVARARTVRRREDVIAAGLTIGFPWADVPTAGPAAIVTVLRDGGSDPAALAQDLARGLWDSRAATQLNFATPAEAMVQARAGKPGDAPLVLADIADNPAGGAYGDSPNLLRAMLEARLDNAAFATLADRASVAAAAAAGEGAALTLSLGGWHDPATTPPLCVTAQVERLHGGRFCCAGPVLRGVVVDMGPTALLRVDGVRVVVASRALAVTDVNLFHVLGLDPEKLTTIALKSRNHHRAAFGPLARDVLLVDAGGIATMRLKSLAYRNLPRPLWPLDSSASFADTRLVETTDERPLSEQ